MKKLCKYPVRKWKDIPIETRERIKRELSVPLPPTEEKMKLLREIGPRGNYNKHIYCLLIIGTSLILTISVTILLILLYL